MFHQAFLASVILLNRKFSIRVFVFCTFKTGVVELQLRESNTRGFYAPELTVHSIGTYADAMFLMQRGQRRRSV